MKRDRLIKRAKRHALVGIISILMTVMFVLVRPGMLPVHAWNRAFGDAAFVLLLFAMFLGPLAKFHNRVRRYRSWRHEFGVWTVILAIMHLIILLDGWVQWDLSGFWTRGNGELNPAFLMGNLVGTVALVYGMILLITSNVWLLSMSRMIVPDEYRHIE